MPMGCVEIQLRGGRFHEYLPVRLAVPHKSWRSQWFYLKNVASPPYRSTPF